MADAEKDLAEARKAWQLKCRSDASISRLRGYSRMTSGMKDDMNKALRVNAEAISTLNRILGVVVNPDAPQPVPSAPATDN